MKILILQLARFGDILQTWPSLKGLRRIYPKAEIHILTRKNFVSAIEDFGLVNNIWLLDSEAILQPLLHNENYKESILVINELIQRLNQEDFNIVINLSFSSFSSHLISKIKTKQVRGYSRFADGTVDFADTTSAYFYAQVGVGRSNRIHICDLFAKVAGVELIKEDWDFSNLAKVKNFESRYIVVHLGASNSKKQYPVDLWLKALNKFIENNECDIVLIGTENEKQLSEKIVNRCNNKERIINKTGATKFSDLIELFSYAQGFVGCDSAPLQLASLVNLKSLNLSFSTVNFWETGPKSANSRVLYKNTPQDLIPETVAVEMNHLVNQTYSFEPMVYVQNQVSPYKLNFECEETGWKLLKLIYFNGAAPILKRDCIALLQTIQKIARQLSKTLIVLQSNPLNQETLVLINILEHKILISKKLNLVLSPLIDWFETEKRIIPPGDFKNIVIKTQKIYQKLYALCDCLITSSLDKEFENGNNKVDAS